MYKNIMRIFLKTRAYARINILCIIEVRINEIMNVIILKDDADKFDVIL